MRAGQGDADDAVSKHYQSPLYKTGENTRPAALLGVTHCEGQTQKTTTKKSQKHQVLWVKGNSPATSQASRTQGWGWCLEGGGSLEAVCSNWKPATQRCQRVRWLIINARGTIVSIKINRVQISPETLTPNDASGKIWSTGTFPAAQFDRRGHGFNPWLGNWDSTCNMAQPKKKKKLSTRGKKGAPRLGRTRLDT